MQDLIGRYWVQMFLILTHKIMWPGNLIKMHMPAVVRNAQLKVFYLLMKIG